MPTLLDVDTDGATATIEMAAVTRLSRYWLPSRLRRLRRAA